MNAHECFINFSSKVIRRIYDNLIVALWRVIEFYLLRSSKKFFKSL